MDRERLAREGAFIVEREPGEGDEIAGVQCALCGSRRLAGRAAHVAGRCAAVILHCEGCGAETAVTAMLADREESGG